MTPISLAAPAIFPAEALAALTEIAANAYARRGVALDHR